jgi:hypothetical protein
VRSLKILSVTEDESVYVGNGVVEWRVYIENNGRKEVCCFVDMEGPVFRYGNRQIVRSSRSVCAFPGQDNYSGLTGVTTHIGTTGRFRPGRRPIGLDGLPQGQGQDQDQDLGEAFGDPPVTGQFGQTK